MNIPLLIFTHFVAALVGAAIGVWATEILHDLDILAKKETSMTATPKKKTSRRGAFLKRLRFPTWLTKMTRLIGRPFAALSMTRFGQFVRRNVYNLLFGVVILAVAQGVYQANHVESCGTNYSNHLAVALDSRQAFTKKFDKADERTENAIIALGIPGNDTKDFKELIDAAKAKHQLRLERDAARKAHPYPDPPKEFCS